MNASELLAEQLAAHRNTMQWVIDTLKECGNDPRWRAKCVDRLRECIERDAEYATMIAAAREILGGVACA